MTLICIVLEPETRVPAERMSELVGIQPQECLTGRDIEIILGQRLQCNPDKGS
jgi:hypothetical protein